MGSFNCATDVKYCAVPNIQRFMHVAPQALLLVTLEVHQDVWSVFPLTLFTVSLQEPSEFGKRLVKCSIKHRKLSRIARKISVCCFG